MVPRIVIKIYSVTGPPIFHRGMGPRGMRPGMRPPFGPRGPFDPREGEAFFRGPFDDNRGPPSSHLRPPPFGGPPGPPLPDPWRNPDAVPPPLPPVWASMEGNNGHEPDEHTRENHVNQRDNKGHMSRDKHQDRDRDSRNSRNRKSRWGNASPLPQEQPEASRSEQESGENKKMFEESRTADNDNSKGADEHPDESTIKDSSTELQPPKADVDIGHENPEMNHVLTISDPNNFDIQSFEKHDAPESHEFDQPQDIDRAPEQEHYHHQQQHQQDQPEPEVQSHQEKIEQHHQQEEHHSSVEDENTSKPMEIQNESDAPVIASEETL